MKLFTAITVVIALVYPVLAEKPKIEGGQKMWRCREGDTIDLIYKIQNAESYEWIYKHDNEDVTFTETETIEDDVLIAKLSIQNIAKGNGGGGGVYFLTAANGDETSKKTTKIVVYGENQKNFNLKKTSVGVGFIDLKWTRFLHYTQTMKKQIIKFRKPGETEWKTQPVNKLNFVGKIFTEPKQTYEITMDGSKGSSPNITSNTIFVTTTASEECLVDDCIECMGTKSDTCEVCADGYIRKKVGKKGSKRQECQYRGESHCRKFEKSKCKLCDNNFTLVDGKCEESAVPNCQLYVDGICKYCYLGYFKTYDGFCEVCKDPNCDFCTSGGPCMACKVGFQLGKMIDGRMCEDAGLSTCAVAHKGTCKKCKFGYYRENDGCTACTTIDENCVACNEDGTCRACKMYYKVKEGLCFEAASMKEDKRMIGNSMLDYLNDREKRSTDEDSDEEESDNDEDFNNDEASEADEDFDIDQDHDYNEDEENEENEKLEALWEPKDSWGFENKEGMAYYLEVEVQVHVAQTIYMHYLTQLQNNPKKAVDVLRNRFLSSYNFLGWALNRMIYDDEDEDKIFVQIVPWEIMLYMDNNVLPVELKSKKGYRSTNVNDWHLKSVQGSWSRLLRNIENLNGHIADIHYYSTKAGLNGPSGIAIKTCCFGLAIGHDSPGGLVGHELGHNLGMSDYRGPNGVGIYKFGKPGSYYSQYQVAGMKRNMLKPRSNFNESVCEPITMEDGRIIGRVDVDQKYHHGAEMTRTQVCQWFAGDDCEESENSKNSEEKNCQKYECTCQSGKTKTVGGEYRGMECGGEKRCGGKKCNSKTDKYEWKKAYSVGNAECINAIDVNTITKERLIEDYDCIDNYNNICFYGEKRLKDKIFPSE